MTSHSFIRCIVDDNSMNNFQMYCRYVMSKINGKRTNKWKKNTDSGYLIFVSLVYELCAVFSVHIAIILCKKEKKKIYSRLHLRQNGHFHSL